MRIEDMRKKAKEVAFKDIEVCECFIDWDGDLSIKISDAKSYNALMFSSGLLWACDENSPITPVKTHIVIESEE